MNTYRDNLRETIKETLAKIRAEKVEQGALVSIAKDELFFAEGKQSIANQYWVDCIAHQQEIHAISVQGVACGNSSSNLTNTAETASKKVSELVTNTATSAKNVQIAANAIAKLASSMGSAKNISFATMQGSNIDDQVIKAEDHIKKTAYLAERVTIDAMQASSNAAQIMTPKVFEEVTATNAEFAELAQASDTQLETATTAVKTSQQALSQSNTDLIVAKGKLNVVEKIYHGTDTSLTSTNSTLNYNLTVENISAISVNVGFDAYVPTEAKKNDANNYYVFAVNADLQETITYEYVENNFHKHADKRFVKVKEHKPTKPNEGHFNETISLFGSECILDIEGNKIPQGVPYVLFLFIVLNDKYKRKINKYNDIMSVPSAEFVLTNQLPEADFSSFIDTENKVVFSVEEQPNDSCELRLMLLPVKTSSHLGYYKDLNDAPIDWFTVEIAEQISESNYIRMTPDADDVVNETEAHKSKGKKSKAQERDENDENTAKSELNKTQTDSKASVYSAILKEGQTDVFGSLVDTENQYVPIVLTSIEDGSSSAAEYSSALSSLVCKPIAPKFSVKS